LAERHYFVVVVLLLEPVPLPPVVPLVLPPIDGFVLEPLLPEPEAPDVPPIELPVPLVLPGVVEPVPLAPIDVVPPEPLVPAVVVSVLVLELPVVVLGDVVLALPVMLPLPLDPVDPVVELPVPDELVAPVPEPPASPALWHAPSERAATTVMAAQAAWVRVVFIRNSLEMGCVQRGRTACAVLW
jgi:hypothetical protein